MNRRRFVLSLGGAWVAWRLPDGSTAGAEPIVPAPLSGSRASASVVRQSSRALGTTVTLTVVHADAARARAAIRAALAELQSVESLMSLYQADSQLCQLNRERQLRAPHPQLVHVLRTAEQVSRATGGAFDVTIQPLWQLYAQHARRGTVPPATEIQRRLESVDWRQIEIEDGQIRLRHPEAAITLNGIAQGFATDRVAEVLRQHGVEQALIDAGEIRPLGASNTARPWRVGVQHPHDDDAFVTLVDLTDRCLATSGDYEMFFSKDRRAHHILDPRTGQSPISVASCSVLAPSAMLADALSTAFFAMGPDAATRSWQHFDQVDVLFVGKDGRVQATDGFASVSASRTPG